MNPLTKMLKGAQKAPLIEKEVPAEEKKASEGRTAISISGLEKSYGSFSVLQGIDIQVQEGEAFGLIGRNGIGKSTTIDCMVGLKSFEKGTISIFGDDVLLSPEAAKRHFGYVASEPTAYEVMTGKEYLSFVAGAYGVRQDRFVTNYRLLADRLRFNDQDLKKRIREYSHGMKQKICLIGSLIHNPEIWILDEPTVGLDLVVSEMLFNLMRDLKANGRTIFLTSHNIDFVSKICDKVGILDGGRIRRTIDFRTQPMERRRLKEIFRQFDVEEENE